MSQAIDKHVAQAIIEIAIFLEFSDEETINQDSSMQVFEQLSATLQKADSETKLLLCAHFENIAAKYAGEQAMFVESLGDALGLN